MQEQNFEKQVRQKMEELSLTPSAPVWKNVEAQIRQKRDRRRLLFWLPLFALSLIGGIWLVNKNNNNIKSTSIVTKEKGNHSNDTTLILEDHKTKPYLNQQKEQPDIAGENFQSKNKIRDQIKLSGSPSQALKNDEKYFQKPNQKRALHVPTTIGILKKGQNDLNENVLAQTPSLSNKVNESKTSGQPGDNRIKETAIYDSMANNSEVKNEVIVVDSSNKLLPDNGEEEKDSLLHSSAIAKAIIQPASKWKLAITAGLGRSGVSNGVNLFGGADKLAETNIFADARYLSNTNPSPSNPATYRPPSSQRKSLSFSTGLLLKKHIRKRTVLSTGLVYDFYSTKISVGQNITSDTIVSQNNNVNRFYANSGSSFSDYRNEFHFVSLPLSFSFPLLSKKPLDFHVGLSLQQLVKTNALLYSPMSQIYYEDKSAFNKTYVFSELGFEYSFILSKKIALIMGPRLNYSHSRVIKGSSGHHLFSYGLATQIIFQKNK